MAIKRAEIGFTNSGTLQTDLIGGFNVDLTASTVVQNVPLLPGFLVRPGKQVIGQGYSTKQILPTTSGIYNFYDLTNPQKSIVLWYYAISGSSNNGGVLTQNGAVTTEHGLQFSTVSGLLYFRLNSVLVYPVSPSGTLSTSGWRMATVTINRATSSIQLYDNNNLSQSLSGVIPSTTATDSTAIGVDRLGNNARFLLGTLQVYSGVLTPAEINQIYQSNLLDTITNHPFITLSGNIYSPTFALVSGAKVCAFHHNSNTIHSNYNSVSGEYICYLPTSGNYTIFSSNSGTLGGISIAAAVQSSGVATFYDS